MEKIDSVVNTGLLSNPFDLSKLPFISSSLQTLYEGKIRLSTNFGIRGIQKSFNINEVIRLEESKNQTNGTNLNSIIDTKKSEGILLAKKGIEENECREYFIQVIDAMSYLHNLLFFKFISTKYLLNKFIKFVGFILAVMYCQSQS